MWRRQHRQYEQRFLVADRDHHVGFRVKHQHDDRDKPDADRDSIARGGDGDGDVLSGKHVAGSSNGQLGNRNADYILRERWHLLDHRCLWGIEQLRGQYVERDLHYGKREPDGDGDYACAIDDLDDDRHEHHLDRDGIACCGDGDGDLLQRHYLAGDGGAQFGNGNADNFVLECGELHSDRDIRRQRFVRIEHIERGHGVGYLFVELRQCKHDDAFGLTTLGLSRLASGADGDGIAFGGDRDGDVL